MRRLRDAHPASQQELELLGCQQPLRQQRARAQQRRKEKLVFFEQRAAHVGVERVREVVSNMAQALWHVVAALCILHGHIAACAVCSKRQ